MDAWVASEPKPTWTQKGIVLRFRQRSGVVDFVFSGIDGFVRHRTGMNAALLSHYGFLSVFPLLAVLTTILGFVLQNNPDLQETIVDSAFANIPFIGETIANNPNDLHGSVGVLIVGLAVSLWAGTKAFAVAQIAMNDIWEIPQHDRPKLPETRVRALIGIVIVGTAQIASGIVSGIIGVGEKGPIALLILVGIAVSINIAVLLGSFRVLTARHLNRRQLLPGALVGGLAFSLLQVVGGAIVARSIKRASPVYGSFATVIALLTWLSLHAMVALVGVEANAALDRRRDQRVTVPE